MALFAGEPSPALKERAMRMRPVFFLSVFLLCASFASAQPAGRDKLLVVVNRAPQTVTIYRVAGKDLTPLKSIPIGRTPREVCLSPDGSTAYVSNADDNSISVIDLSKMAVTTTITDPRIKYPDGGVVNPDGKKLYVVGSQSDSVVVIDTKTNRVTNEIPLDLKTPRRLTFSPDGRRIYAGCNKTPEIAVIDAATEKVIRRIKVGNETRGGLTFTPDGTLLLAGAVEDDTMYYIDAATEQVTRIQGVPASPQRIVVHPKGAPTFVLSRITATVYAIGDLMKHDKNVIIPVGQAPWGLDISDDGAFVFASSNTDSNITVIDTATLKTVNVVKTEKDPNGIAFRK
jgi:YVTN family beta-propeller protein